MGSACIEQQLDDHAARWIEDVCDGDGLSAKGIASEGYAMLFFSMLAAVT
jgi:hypothetical protein